MGKPNKQQGSTSVVEVMSDQSITEGFFVNTPRKNLAVYQKKKIRGISFPSGWTVRAQEMEDE